MYDLVIIGGGAAGLFSAALAIKKRLSTVIIESNDRVGKKLLATGNGKCNIAAANVSVANYNTQSVAKVLDKYSVKTILDDFANMGLFVREEEGRIYPYSSMASSVLNALRNATSKADILLSSKAEEIVKIKDGYKVSGNNFEVEGKRVCVASGSQATFGKASYELLIQQGCKLKKISPSLLPISVVGDGVKGMQGVRQYVRATLLIDDREWYSECGEMQFKEQAISGIVAFNLSARLAWSGVKNCKVVIDFAPDLHMDKLREVIEISGLENMYHKSIVTAVQNVAHNNDLASAIKNYPITCKVMTDISKAQVASGGISLDCIELETMQVIGKENLYAIGEVLNVDGECGGYNLFWAWSSAKNMIDNLR